MRFEAPGVRIAAVETCDFGLMPAVATGELLERVLPAQAGRWRRSATARALVRELGVEQRYLTSIPGVHDDPALDALDLACSAVERLQARTALVGLDAVLFVSTSNPNPCNSQAALLAQRCRLAGSCMDLKAGCSGGVLGLLQGALLVRGGCRRVLVVMAETLSRFAPPEDPRMLLSVGDGAACVLLEACDGPGFLAMLHGTEPEYAQSMRLAAPFPPRGALPRYVYEFSRTLETARFQAECWRAAFREVLAAAHTPADRLRLAGLHQTHAAQLRTLVPELGLGHAHVPNVIADHGNMGTPTFAVALARGFGELRQGDRYLLQAVGGGVSWCAIVAEHVA